MIGLTRLRPTWARPRKDMMIKVSISAAVILGTLLCGCALERKHIPGANPDLPFSCAVLISNTLFVSGHLGLDPDTGAPPEDPAEEARLVLDRFEESLEAGGMTMDDLVQVAVFCSDVALYDVFNAEYRTRFEGPFPARAFIGSGELLFGARYEIMGIAARR